MTAGSLSAPQPLHEAPVRTRVLCACSATACHATAARQAAGGPYASSDLRAWRAQASWPAGEVAAAAAGDGLGCGGPESAELAPDQAGDRGSAPSDDALAAAAAGARAAAQARRAAAGAAAGPAAGGLDPLGGAAGGAAAEARGGPGGSLGSGRGAAGAHREARSGGARGAHITFGELPPHRCASETPAEVALLCVVAARIPGGCAPMDLLLPASHCTTLHFCVGGHSVPRRRSGRPAENTSGACLALTHWLAAPPSLMILPAASEARRAAGPGRVRPVTARRSCRRCRRCRRSGPRCQRWGPGTPCICALNNVSCMQITCMQPSLIRRATLVYDRESGERYT